MTDFYIKAYETTAPHLGGCGLHDPLAVGVAVDPTLVTVHPINMKVDVEARLAAAPLAMRTVSTTRTRRWEPRSTSMCRASSTSS